MAYASGSFSGTAGSAQTSLYVLRNTTYGTNPAELFLDGGLNNKRLTVEDGRSMTFDILVVGRNVIGDSAGYRIEGIIENNGGIVTMVGSSAKPLGEDVGAWYANVAASTSPPALQIWVGGDDSDVLIRWVARVETAEVAW